MDLNKMVLDVMKEKQRSTVKEIADVSLLQHREKVRQALAELAKQNKVIYYDEKWYYINDLIKHLLDEQAKQIKTINKLTKDLTNKFIEISEMMKKRGFYDN